MTKGIGKKVFIPGHVLISPELTSLSFGMYTSKPDEVKEDLPEQIPSKNGILFFNELTLKTNT